MLRTPAAGAFAPPLSPQDRGPTAPREPAVRGLQRAHEGAAPTAAGRADRRSRFRPTFHPSRCLEVFAAFHPCPPEASTSIAEGVPDSIALLRAVDSPDPTVRR